MIDSYTDEEFLEIRQPYLDRLEKIWTGKDDSFYILTSAGYFLSVEKGGRVDVRKGRLFCNSEYEQLFSLATHRFNKMYDDRIHKTKKLKNHLIDLILDRKSKVSESRKELGYG